MKRLVIVTSFATAAALAVAASPVWAAGGSGGGGSASGGGSTSGATGTATATPAAATGGGGGGGGGGGVKTCTPSLTLTAAPATDPATPRALTIGFVTACASRSKVALTATNTRTNVIEWTQADNGLAAFTWSYPQWGTQYRIDGVITDNTTGAVMARGTAQVTSRALPANCGPTLSMTTSAGTTVADWNINVGVAAFWCQGPTNIVVTGTNAATGVEEYRQNLDATGSAVLARPRANTTYNIVVTAYDPLNGSALTSATGTVAVGAYPANCGPSVSLTPSAGTTTTDWGITVGVNTLWCFGPANVLVSATNAATGQVEYSGNYVNTTGSVLFPRPKGRTTYNITATAYDASNGALLATGTTSVTTGVLPANCAQIVNQNVTTGYWGIYAAVWISTSARDCGYGGESVHVKVTNMTSGQVEYENYNMPMSGLLDFEGPIVKFNTPYQFDVDIRGWDNEILDSRSQIVTTPVAR